jgi:hypothetical protein
MEIGVYEKNHKKISEKWSIVYFSAEEGCELKFSLQNRDSTLSRSMVKESSQTEYNE